VCRGNVLLPADGLTSHSPRFGQVLPGVSEVLRLSRRIAVLIAPGLCAHWRKYSK